jgi:signal transduction histidine kinase
MRRRPFATLVNTPRHRLATRYRSGPGAVILCGRNYLSPMFAARVHSQASSDTSPSPTTLAERVSRHAGLIAALIGTLALAGWTFGIEQLKGFGHGITMKPNAALGLIACGIALRYARAPQGGLRDASFAAALFAGALGALTLSEHLFGWDLRIDLLFFQEEAGALATTSPGRMGPNASLSLTLASIALICVRFGTRAAAVWAQSLALAMAVLATLAIVGYVYGAQELYSAARYTGIAWPTAVTLLVIAIGILSARPDVGPVSTIVSDGPGGILARRMLLPGVLAPIVLGYAHLLAERRGLYDRGLGSALFAVSLVVIFAAAIWRTALDLDAAHARERAALAEAERASRLKDEFLATLSHELRTPLNVILGWAHMVQSPRPENAGRDPAARIVERNAKMLARLVDDLLDVSRIATGRLHLDRKPIDLVAVASAALDAIGVEAGTRGIRLARQFDGPALTLGDAGRLQQVVNNLLSNALKFTPAGGSVEVRVETRPSAVELTVSDTGEGIDPAFLSHVFDRFRQEDGTSTREHGGLGLGLSIVREVTELHGGTVEAFSDGRGRGSRFLVSLPRLDDVERA